MFSPAISVMQLLDHLMIFIGNFILFLEWWLGLRIDKLLAGLVFIRILKGFHLCGVQSFSACASYTLNSLGEDTLSIRVIFLLRLRSERCGNFKRIPLGDLPGLGCNTLLHSREIITIIICHNRLSLTREQSFLLSLIVHGWPPHCGSITRFGDLEVLHVRTGDGLGLAELGLGGSGSLASRIGRPFNFLSDLNTLHLFDVIFSKFWDLGSNIVIRYGRLRPLSTKHGSCHLVENSTLITVIPYDPKLVKRIMRSTLVKTFKINMDQADSFFVIDICASVHGTRSCNRYASALSRDLEFIRVTEMDLV